MPTNGARLKILKIKLNVSEYGPIVWIYSLNQKSHWKFQKILTDGATEQNFEIFSLDAIVTDPMLDIFSSY